MRRLLLAAAVAALSPSASFGAIVEAVRVDAAPASAVSAVPGALSFSAPTSALGLSAPSLSAAPAFAPAPPAAPAAGPIRASALPAAVPVLPAAAPAILPAAAANDGPPVYSAADGAAFADAETVPLALLAVDGRLADKFLAAHPDSGPLLIGKFQEVLRKIFLTAPGRRGDASLAALDDRAARSGDPETVALARVLNDLPRLTAEGMVRVSPRTLTADQLEDRQAGWDRDADGRPIADLVVVGAGPAGLSTGLHAAHLGLKTVVLEAGYAAQSFSDAAMKPVYRMRTPSTRNSLAQAPFSPPELVADAGMLGKLDAYREIGQSADSALYAKTRTPPLLGARAGLDAPAADAAIASARNELLQHFSDAVAAIEKRGGIVAERSPVQSVTKGADGLWTIVVGGRVQRARKLALAQGQVGTALQHATLPPDLVRAARDAGLDALTLKDRNDLENENGALDALSRTLAAGKTPRRRLLLNDALLGSPQVERAFRLLPRGARAMVVGSGESAVKAAVAALRLNPGLKLDLFVKDALQPAQLQIPTAHAAPDAIARALNDPDEAARTVAEWEAFGTPVTPATLADLEALKAAGRLRVIPLGKKCIAAADGDPDPNHTIEIHRARRGNRTVVQVFAVDPEVVAHLQAEGIGARDAVSGRWLVSEIDGPIVSAVGYGRASLRRDPLTTGLAAEGRLVPTRGATKATAHEFAVSRENPLVSAGDPDLYFVGAQNTTMSADSAIPGAVARAAAIAADAKARLAPAPKPKGRRPGLRGMIRRFWRGDR